MTRFLLTGALGVAMYTMMIYLIWHSSQEPINKTIDCSVAEFHPDFTPRMREACRLARRQKL
jgi:hypothetical protein